MDRTVVHPAQRQQIVGGVRSAVLTQANMVQVEKLALLHPGTRQRRRSRCNTARRSAGGMVCFARAPVGARDGRLGAGVPVRAHRGVPLESRHPCSDLLPIALCHLHHIRPHTQPLAVRRLPSGAAVGANTQRDLVARPALVLRSLQHGARHLEQHGFVIERLAAAAPQLAARLAKQRQRLRRHFHAQHVTQQRGIAARCRHITGPLSCDRRFDLPQGLPPREFAPCALRLRNGDARELAHHRPVQRALFQRLRKRRQGLQRFGHAQLLLRRARLVSEQPLHGLAEAAKPQVQVHTRAKGSQQPAAFFSICRRPLARQPRQGFVRHQPSAAFARHQHDSPMPSS